MGVLIGDCSRAEHLAEHRLSNGPVMAAVTLDLDGDGWVEGQNAGAHSYGAHHGELDEPTPFGLASSALKSTGASTAPISTLAAQVEDVRPSV